ncbi:MAG: DUF3576 domain-containing protein [Alphaproteobacteria bacterium]|nr:DUF3576 domain-containing protein [Alphaproteobacteria bacterium]
MGWNLTEWRAAGRIAAVVFSVLLTAACSGDSKDEKEVKVAPTGHNVSIPAPRALTSFGADSQGIGVNTFLWRGALETVSFMPLSSADPYGGVIITDWYAPPETPSERFKINIYVRGKELRSDGVKAVVFRQKLDPTELWIDDIVDPQTAVDLENAILAQARRIRLQELDE